MTNPELRHRAVRLYKTLLYMGRDYPKGYEYFRGRCHNVFKKNKDVQDEDQIKKLLGHGEFVVKELEALYFLKKYRTLKNRYYKDEDQIDKVLHKIETAASENPQSSTLNKSS